LIVKTGLLPDVLKPAFHCVRAHWIRGFMALQLVRRGRREIPLAVSDIVIFMGQCGR